jgi:hypothetical protein
VQHTTRTGTGVVTLSLMNRKTVLEKDYEFSLT